MRILFFMAYCGRTGSEMSLYNIICHANRRRFEMAVACRSDGVLLRELPADVPGFAYNSSLLHRNYSKLYSKVFRNPNSRAVMSLHNRYRPDVWYVNTITQPEILRQAHYNNIPYVLHSHEMEHILSVLDENDIRNMIEHPKLVIACSEASAAVLRTLGRENNIEVCYESVALNKVKSDAEKRRQIRRNIGVSDSTFVWAMSGTFDANKNPALFVELAARLLEQNLDTHFIWIGGPDNGYSIYAKQQAIRFGIADKITWAGKRTQDDYYDYLSASDGFVLTSRRDSFPLVMIEAAALGKPIVSFNSGGVKEFLLDQMGTVVKSWNTAELLQTMIETMRGEILFDSDVARRRAQEFDASVQVKHWENVMQKHFGYPTAKRVRSN
jgi:L-malate glycosyltransferase